MSAKHSTYNDLIAIRKQRAQDPGMPAASSIPNECSALFGFVRERGIDPDTEIGTTLRLSFYKFQKRHLKALVDQGMPSNQVANRKTLLHRWHNFLSALDREEAHATGSDTPFQARCKQIFGPGGAAVKPTAKALRVAPSTIFGWIRGATPQRNSHRVISVLELRLGLSKGELTGLLAKPTAILPSRSTSLSNKNPTTTVRHKNAKAPLEKRPHAKLVSTRYRLKAEDASVRLKKQWQELIALKTSKLRLAEAGAAAQIVDRNYWRLRPVVTAGAENWTCKIGSQWVPSASVAFGLISAYLGFLTLSVNDGGLGLQASEAHDLALVTNLEYLEAYQRFRFERAGGRLSPSIGHLFRIIGMLTHPELGYLTNSPDAGTIMGIFDPEKWHRHCARMHTVARAMATSGGDAPSTSRNPFERIAPILDRENPLSSLREALSIHHASCPAEGGVSKAIWSRNRLLLALLFSNPLRACNMKLLTWRKDNTGNLRRNPDGSWYILVPANELKNYRRKEDYKVEVQEFAWPFIESYLKYDRPLLVDPNVDYLFVSSHNPGKIWKTMNSNFFSLTEKLFPDTRGFRPHAVRHIVATALVKRCRSFIDAARLLHDREDTVRLHYGRYLAEDGSRALAEIIQSALGT